MRAHNLAALFCFGPNAAAKSLEYRKFVACSSGRRRVDLPILPAYKDMAIVSGSLGGRFSLFGKESSCRSRR
jgi:hypothetical protein